MTAAIAPVAPTAAQAAAAQPPAEAGDNGDAFAALMSDAQVLPPANTGVASEEPATGKNDAEDEPEMSSADGSAVLALLQSLFTPEARPTAKNDAASANVAGDEDVAPLPAPVSADPALAEVSLMASPSQTDESASSPTSDFLETLPAEDFITSSFDASAFTAAAPIAAGVASTSESLSASIPVRSDAASAPLSTASDQWRESLSERISWLADKAGTGQQEAHIELHPAELGGLQIRVQIEADGRMAVRFDVETEQARKLIESSLQQLRETMTVNASSGASTPQFELSGGAQRQGGEQAWYSSRKARGVESEPVGSDIAVSTVAAQRLSQGLVDQFA